MGFNLNQSQGQGFGASGPNHAPGLVPDPGSVAGTSRFLREDNTFAAPPGLPTIANDTVLGNISGSPATPVGLTQTQLTALINAFTSALSGAVPASGGGTVNFLRADATWTVPAVSASGTLVAITNYTSTQTIAIPATATKGFVRLLGPGGNANSTAAGNSSVGGNGGYLEKLLTGLTPGNTLILTLPGGGSGLASTLASGTQAISTLTANAGGNGGNASAGAGGTASGGDTNQTGATGFVDTVDGTIASQCATPLGAPAGANVNSGANTGVGAVSTNGAGAFTGGSGKSKIDWFT